MDDNEVDLKQLAAEYFDVSYADYHRKAYAPEHEIDRLRSMYVNHLSRYAPEDQAFLIKWHNARLKNNDSV